MDKIIIDVKDFCLEQILECGQCFRFYKLGEKEYIIIAKNKLLRAKQVDNKLTLYCSKDEYNEIWREYFDLDRDYGKIKEILSLKDIYLMEAIKEKYGVRLLRQEPWETLISFIISQTKQIPHIKKLIEVLSKEYGKYIGEYLGVSYYSFPTPKELSLATEDDLKKLKVGFRASYILDAIKFITEGIINLDLINDMPYEDAKKELVSIKGVGNKIADCVLLFAYSKYEVFPTDVWVKRVMEYYYFKNNTKLDKIQEFAKNYFGEYAGFAQQYLFYYARDHKIGK